MLNSILYQEPADKKLQIYALFGGLITTTAFGVCWLCGTDPWGESICPVIITVGHKPVLAYLADLADIPAASVFASLASMECRLGVSEPGASAITHTQKHVHATRVS
jgi:hypothetical protein